MPKRQAGLLSTEQEFVASVVGGSCIMATLGTNYCLGGLSPYIVSRLRANRTGDEHVSDYINTGSIVWVFVAAAMFQGIGMLTSGFLVARVSLDRRWSILAGCLISSIGTCLTGVTVCVSLGLVILTSGVIFGFGQGLAYALILESVTSWTDTRKGLLTGVLAGSFAAGAIVFLPIQTRMVNPENLTPDWRIGTDRLFAQSRVLQNTPQSFFVMSAVYAAVQVAFVILVRRRRGLDDAGNDAASEATMLIGLGGADKPATAAAAAAASVAAANEDDAADSGEPQSLTSATPPLAASAAANWTLRRAVASLPFIVMGASIFFLTPASIVLPSLDKAYGETFISNDMLLSVLAGIGAVFNAGGRLVAGAVIDRVHFRVCVLVQGLLLAGLHAVTPLSTATHPALYFLLVCLVNFVFAGVFVFFPYAVEDLYGSALFPHVYGLVFLFKAVSGALIAVVTTTSLGLLGWTGVMLLTAATSCIGGLLILLYNTERWRLTVSFL